MCCLEVFQEDDFNSLEGDLFSDVGSLYCTRLGSVSSVIVHVVSRSST